MKVQGKVFLVTGAGGGIGGELALGLIARGAKVVGVDLRPEGMSEVKQRAGELADNFCAHAADITDRTATAKLPAAVIKQYGQIDAVINCAGIIQPFVRVNELDYEAIERVMNINFYGTLYVTKACLPHLLERPEAYIANVSSMGGFLPVPGQSVYGASKAAVKLLTEGLYAELLDTPVRVSVIYPGATNTHITENSKVAMPTSKGVDTAKLQAAALPAAEAARIIIRGIERNKPQIFTGKDSRTMNKLYRLNPVFTIKLIARQMRSLLK